MPTIRPITDVPKMRAPIRFTAAITQNQWYDAWTGATCDAGAGTIKRNVRLIGIGLDQATAQETLEIRIIADSFDETTSQIAVAGTDYFIELYATADYAVSISPYTVDHVTNRPYLLEARSLQIMYRKTSAAGANGTRIKTIYAQW